MLLLVLAVITLTYLTVCYMDSRWSIDAEKESTTHLGYLTLCALLFCLGFVVGRWGEGVAELVGGLFL